MENEELEYECVRFESLVKVQKRIWGISNTWINLVKRNEMMNRVLEHFKIRVCIVKRIIWVIIQRIGRRKISIGGEGCKFDLGCAMTLIEVCGLKDSEGVSDSD